MGGKGGRFSFHLLVEGEGGFSEHEHLNKEIQ